MHRDVSFNYGAILVRDVFASLGASSDARARLARWFTGYVGGAAFPFSSARASLRAILSAAGMRAGDEVILSSFTCLAVPEAVRYAGGTPVYADVAAGGWASGICEIERVASARTRAVVVQHTYGIATSVGPISALCRKREWVLIEDCALALGSRAANGNLGSFGDAAIFSFEMSKGVTAGWGGLAVVHKTELRNAMERSYAEIPEPSNLRITRDMIEVGISTALYCSTWYVLGKHAVRLLYRSGLFRAASFSLRPSIPIGWSHRLSKIQSSLVVRQLDRIDDMRRRSQEIVRRYRSWLDASGRPDVSGSRAPYQHLLRFPLLVDDAAGLVRRASQAGIELGKWFDAPVAPMPVPAAAVNYRWGSCPRAEYLSRHVVNLPVHGRIKDREITRVLRLLDELRVRCLPHPAEVLSIGV